MKALLSFLSEINDLTKNSGVQDLMQLKKELFITRNDNERLKKENKELHNQMKHKDKEITVLTNRITNQALVEYSHEQELESKLAKERDEIIPNKQMRSTDSDWKTHNRMRSEYSRETLPKNNSDNKIGLTFAKQDHNVQRQPEEPISQLSLYERTLERMNHKAIYSRSIEGKKARDRLTPPNPGLNTSTNTSGQRNSTKKPTAAYLLNDSHDRNGRQYANEVSYNNYIQTDKRVGTLIRKPKNDGNDGQPVASSKLRNTVLKKIQADEAELSFEGSRRYGESRYSSSSNQRDYSLEHYKKQMAKDKTHDYDSLKDSGKDGKRDSRSGSRSVSRSVNKPIDISNDRINVGKLLDYYRDNYD